MNTRRPPIAPKASQQAIGPLEGQQIVLESQTASPRQPSVSEYGTFHSSLRLRSPRPTDVYSGAVASLHQGDERSASKMKHSGPSPHTSPSRRRTACTLASVSTFHQLAPLPTTTNMDDNIGVCGYKTITICGDGSAPIVIGTASARVLSALEDHRTGTQLDCTSASASAQHANTRKVSSAPDSQAAQSHKSTSGNPWRSGLHDPKGPAASLQQPTATHYGSPRTAALAAQVQARGMLPSQGGWVSSGGGAVTSTGPTVFSRISAPPSPPLHLASAIVASGGGGVATSLASSTATLPSLTSLGSGGGGIPQLRKETAFSPENFSPAAFDSPGGPAGLGLRLTALSRVGSPGSPSPPSSLPMTPSAPSHRPRPPGEVPNAIRSARKLSHLASPEARQLHHSGSITTGGSGLGMPPAASRQLQLPPVGAPDDSPPAAALRRSISMGAGLGPSYGSQPGTPSASRPNSSRGGSAVQRPVQALVDAVRSRDESKLAEILEALRTPQGNVMGINERHSISSLTPLYEAVMTTSTTLAAMLLAAGADPNLGYLPQGPPLLLCAGHGDVDMVHLLLTWGASVDAMDMDNSTALHHACRCNHPEVAKLLIQNGANLSARDVEGCAPFDRASAEFPRLVYAASLPAPHPSGRQALPPNYHAMHQQHHLGGQLQAEGSGGAVSRGVSETGLELACSPERHPFPAASGPMSAAAAAAAAQVAYNYYEGSMGGGSMHPGLSRRSSGIAVAAAGPSGRPLNSTVVSPVSQLDLEMGRANSCNMGSSGGGGGGAGAGGVVSGSGGGGLGTFGSGPLVGSLRPAPPSERAGTFGGPRSRRNSSQVIVQQYPAPVLTSTTDPSPRPPSSEGGGGGGEGAASAASSAAPGAHRGRAPASPMLMDAETPLASPPMLQLPGSVRRQLSRGATMGDILAAFQKEDEELIRSSLVCGSPFGFGVGVDDHGQEEPQHEMQEAGKAIIESTRPPKLNIPSEAAKFTFGVPPGTSAPVFGLPPGTSAPVFGLQPGDQKKAAPTQQLPKIPIRIPQSSFIRFGTRMQVHGPQRSGDDEDDAASDATMGLTATNSTGAASSRADSAFLPSRKNSGEVSFNPAMSGFAAKPDAGAPPTVPSLAAPVTPDQLVPLKAEPMPPTPFSTTVPEVEAHLPAAIAKPPAARSTCASGKPPISGGGAAHSTICDGTGSSPCVTARRMSNSAEDLGGTPPLVRDDSPIRSREGGNAGSGGGRAGVMNSVRHASVRTSRMAEDALKKICKNKEDEKVIQVRAAALFRNSIDLTTGELSWTRGELLGEGAYGKVYMGLNQQNGELMAVKIMKLIDVHGDRDSTAAQLAELHHEMNLYKTLKHRHVVGYIDSHYDRKENSFYIFLEYVPGGSIISMRKKFRKFSEEVVRLYTRQLLEGLEYLHSQKVVHRDLKGGNVLVSRDGVVKLADFGASKAYRDHTVTECMKSVHGSVFWMAPEIIRGTGYGRSADIWSLGCTVIEIISGTRPWPHLEDQWSAIFTIAKTEEGPPRPDGISDEARRFLDRCLEIDPTKRPSAADLLKDPFVMRPPSAAAASNRGDC